MENEVLKLTEYDKLSYDSSTQMMKAMLPYIPTAIQPGFAYAIIFREFSNLRKNIYSETASELGICSADRPVMQMSDILKEIRQYGSEKQKSFIDMIMNMQKTMSVYQQYMQLLNSMGGFPSTGNKSGQSNSFSEEFTFDIDKAMQELSREQGNILNNLSTQTI